MRKTLLILWLVAAVIGGCTKKYCNIDEEPGATASVPFGQLGDLGKVRRFREWLENVDSDHVVAMYTCEGMASIESPGYFYKSLDPNDLWSPIKYRVPLTAGRLSEQILAKIGRVQLFDMRDVHWFANAFMGDLVFHERPPPPQEWADAMSTGDKLLLINMMCKEEEATWQNPPDHFGTCAKTAENETPGENPGPAPTYGPVPPPGPTCTPEHLCEQPPL